MRPTRSKKGEREMRDLGKQGNALFAKIAAGIERVGDCRTLDNAPGVFMALHVEAVDAKRVGEHSGLLISLAHYGEQNGDLMRDPDVVFLRVADAAYPVSYRNDYAGIDREYVIWDGAGGTSCQINKRMQADLASFCRVWMRNVRHQQLEPMRAGLVAV